MGAGADPPVISVAGGKLDTVKTFKYRGANITEDGRSDSEIKVRQAIATGSLVKLKIIWQDRKISMPFKIRFIRVLTALYGCES